MFTCLELLGSVIFLAISAVLKLSDSMMFPCRSQGSALSTVFSLSVVNVQIRNEMNHSDLITDITLFVIHSN